MNILFLGDVVAKSGRDAVIRDLRSLKSEYSADLTIVNAENAAHGKGITLKIYNQLIAAGADVITLGNHAFARQEMIGMMDQCPFLVRPVNMEPKNIGNLYLIRTVQGKKIAVVNILCTIFMNNYTESSFSAMKKTLESIDADIIIVDLHGETTAEKAVFGRYFADRVTAIIGTHTHVQTADERIIDGCAFITDVGMCGAYDSIIGRDIDEVVRHMVENRQTVYEPAVGPAVICGCLIEVDDTTGRALRIERIQRRP